MTGPRSNKRQTPSSLAVGPVYSMYTTPWLVTRDAKTRGNIACLPASDVVHRIEKNGMDVTIPNGGASTREAHRAAASKDAGRAAGRVTALEGNTGANSLPPDLEKAWASGRLHLL
jgi:hypothetical protein